MTDYIEIGVGRQDANLFKVGRDDQGPYVFVRDPRASRFAVSRSDDHLQVSALPSPPTVVVDDRIMTYAYVSIQSDAMQTLRGPIRLYRTVGGALVELIVDYLDFSWWFTPIAQPTYRYNNLWYGQWTSMWWDGFGLLQPETDYRMFIYWYSHGMPNSYNALQQVDFTTPAGPAFHYIPQFMKRMALDAPEW